MAGLSRNCYAQFIAAMLSPDFQNPLGYAACHVFCDDYFLCLQAIRFWLVGSTAHAYPVSKLLHPLLRSWTIMGIRASAPIAFALHLHRVDLFGVSLILLCHKRNRGLIQLRWGQCPRALASAALNRRRNVVIESGT